MSEEPSVRVYLSALDWDRRGVEVMRFHLTYRGQLRPHRVPSPGDADKMAPVIHKIRRHFHPQLRHLWRTNRFLSKKRSWPTDWGLPAEPDDAQIPLVEVVARSHQVNGFRFVPLVKKDWHLECQLSILFLRRDHTGTSLLHHGDLDNRLKTLIDALRYPETPSEAGGAVPQPDEEPFFCLLEDDKLITGLKVETGQLLDAALPDEDETTVSLVIEVEVRPYHMTNFNQAFG